MSLVNKLEREKDSPKSKEGVEDILANCTGLSIEEIGDKLVKHSIIADSDKEILLQSLRKKLPEGVIKNLRKKYQTCFDHNTLLYDELIKILKLLNKENIEIILLKGAALAVAVYQDIGLRSMSDIDLLIKKDDLYKVINILRQANYAPVTKENVSNEWNYEYSMNIHFFKQIEPRIEFDLHWNLIRPPMFFPIKEENIWEKAKEIKIGDEKTLILSNEDMILHLCSHYSFHHTFNFGLRSLCDIAETIRMNGAEINWHNLLTCAIEYKLEHCLYGALSLTKNNTSVKIPSDFFEQLKSNCKRGFVRWIELKTIDPKYSNLQKIDTFTRLLLIKNTVDKIKFLKLLLLPSKKEISIKNSLPQDSNIDYLLCLLAWYKRTFIKIYTKLLTS